MITIEPDVCEYISTYKALEYLGLGWKPYTDNDERLLNENREKIRIPFNDKRPNVLSTEQSEYFNKMHNALAALQFLIRTQKIKLYPQVRGVDHIEWTAEDFSKNDILDEEEIKFLEKVTPLSVYVIFGELDENHLIRSISNINDDGGYDYCIVIENKYGTFFYHDWPKFIKFSEIEPYYKDKESVNIQTPVKSSLTDAVLSNCDDYKTPYMKMISEVIKEYNISKDNQGNVESLKSRFQEKMKERNISDSEKLASAMATIIRVPEAQKGRSYHSQKKIKSKK